MSSVILYPSPGMGHLVSMIELGKLLTNHGLSITILIVDPPYNTGSTAPFIASVASANPSLSFHRLPSVSLPSEISSANHEFLAFETLRLSNPNLKDFLLSTKSIHALIVDFFCACVLDIVEEMRVPCYCFYTSGAGALACFLNFPTLHSHISASFKDLGDTLIDIPGVPPIPADHMPLPMMDNSDDAYKGFLDLARSLFRYDGILVNTFTALEPKALNAINSGLSSAGTTPPPIYPIGPLITSNARAQSNNYDCLSWLDAQPENSVVFLCFGSLGLFSADQLKKIAAGLERSGQRFLWVVRSPPSEDLSKKFEAPPEPDFDVLLPDGFIERMRDIGLVVKSWVPQVEVLNHRAVGGFVTHCGWNSVLEAVSSASAMVAWPLYAEQRWNKVFLVEEMKLAVEMRGFEKGMVTAEEVEERVRWLMESDEGLELKRRTLVAKEAALVAVEKGGSSCEALEQLAKIWGKTAE